MPPESSGNYGYAFNMNNGDPQSDWIIDSGATYHMTYDPTDLACDTVSLQRNITNANSATLPDILTKEIIGRGTKSGDLYFVDDVRTGRVNLAQRAVDHKRHQICSCYIRASTVRFSAPTKGYHCYHPHSHQIYTTMDVTFFEFEMYYTLASSNPPLKGETLHNEQVWTMVTSIDLLLALLAKLAVATLMTVPSSPMAPVLPLADLETSIDTTPPHLQIYSLKEALSDDRWTKAMDEEMTALQKNQTWDLVPLPQGNKRVGCRCVYTKYNADEPMYGVDYTETFAPVAKINTHGLVDSRQLWVKAKQFQSYIFLEMPDIAYAVSVVSQFMHSRSEAHIGAVERILQYLKSSPGRGIMFSKNDHCRIEGYTDADWAINVTDRRSTSGYFTFVGGNLVTWLSKKQKVVVLSSAEAEYRGMAKGECEILWLRRLLVDKHFIKEKLDGNIIQFPFVKSEDQLRIT
ncbi:hypothetical protein D8674_005011 [Pyrus ussuriensis x Pyrus communis]|uniref:Retroviral polymerase SH3-like domain-containing protein n=1 Tax=Pyrus ussuriensis x Pyrus communis TaxID=2448454 RepID=A0A5N5G401_9ROSA|nr:hypothetical protein D8674_005011 [Pyrus ussuriensis x Pyrus communis]